MSRLTRNSAAAKLLRAKFQRGQLTGMEKPKKVWQSSRTFQAYSLESFRVRYNLIRREHLTDRDDYQSPTRARTNDHAKVEKSHADTGRVYAMRLRSRQRASSSARASSPQTSPPRASEHSIAVDTAHLHPHPHPQRVATAFDPLHVVSTWRDAALAQRLSVAVLLPSGVDADMCTVRVCDSGRRLELVVQWPMLMCEPDLLHTSWVRRGDKCRLKRCHPRLVAFEETIARLRAERGGRLRSRACIFLPFVVSTGVLDVHFLKSDAGSIVAYVELEQA